MSDYLVKTIIASVLVAAGLTSFLTMMAVMGKLGEGADAAKLRRHHKRSGYVFVALLVPLAYFGADLLREIGLVQGERAVAV